MKTDTKVRCENLAEMKFQPGENVWAITPKGEVYSVHIRYINGRMIKDDKGLVLYLINYECSRDNQFKDSIFDCSFGGHELYKSKASAKRNAMFTPITFTEDEWFKAIGIKEGVKRADYDQECEFAPCCANISAIRDTLDRVRENKGLVTREKRLLQEQLNGHERISDYDQTTLKRILTAVGVEWKDI